MSKEDEDDPEKKRVRMIILIIIISSSASSYRSYDWLTNFHRDLMAGAVMGRVVHTIVAPIERAKLLLQTQESNLAIVGGGGRRRFKGMVDFIARTVHEEGIVSLWRGNGSSVIRYYPSVALNFSLKVFKFLPF
uniref:ADP/ATP translocase n=1 Tax=Fagus sylvatica TaxID=28930 RepID=A0A2N9J479_FAGSY